jgi:hypothetical protein
MTLGKFHILDNRDDDKPKFTLTRFDKLSLNTSAAYLVRGLIPSQGLTVIWGPLKCGKSFWTFTVAMHIARGLDYCNRRVKQGAVVYLALEGGSGFKNRVEAYKQHNDITDAPFYLITDRVDLIRDHHALIDAIREQVGNEVPVLVVIDTLNRSLADSENKDEDMARYIGAADAIRDAFSCAVAVIHHSGVDGSRPRGHTSLAAAADALIAVSRDDAKNIVVEVEWLKDGQEGAVLLSRLDTVTVGTDSDGEVITSCIVVPLDSGATTFTGSKDRRKTKEAKSLRAFRDALTEALITTGQTIRIYHDGPAMRAVDLKDVKTQFNLRWAIGESDKDKRVDKQRKTFGRILDELPDGFATWVDGDIEWIWNVKNEGGKTQ